MRQLRTRDNPFFGWRIAALSTVIAALTGPGQTIGVSVFIDHFVDDLDLGRPAVSAAYLVGTLLGSTTLPRWGRAVDQMGVRRATTVIAAAFAVSLGLMAGVTGLVTLTLGFTFIRMLGQGALSLSSSVAVALWFERRRGMVIGVVTTVSGALMALVPIGMALGIEAWGWRTTWLVAAAVVATVVVPLSWLGLVDRPSAVGQFVDGQPPDPSSTADEAVEGVDRSTAIRTRAFWVLALVSACVSMLVTALNFHQIALLGEAGLTTSQAAAMFLPQVLGGAVAGVAAGLFVDRFGTRLVPSVSMAFMTVTLLVAGFMDGATAVFVYAVLLGATTGLSRTTVNTTIPDWFGTAHLGSITGAMVLVGVAGSAAGPVTLALTSELLDGWRVASAWWLILPAVIGLMALTTRPPEFGTSRSTCGEPSGDSESGREGHELELPHNLA